MKDKFKENYVAGTMAKVNGLFARIAKRSNGQQVSQLFCEHDHEIHRILKLSTNNSSRKITFSFMNFPKNCS